MDYLSRGKVNIENKSNIVIGNFNVDWSDIKAGSLIAFRDHKLSYEVLCSENKDFVVPFESAIGGNNEIDVLYISSKDRWIFHANDEIRIKIENSICKNGIVQIENISKNKSKISLNSAFSPKGESVKGEIIISKWVITTTTPYSGNSKSESPYSVSSEKTSKLGLPLIYIEGNPICGIYNSAMKKIDDAISEKTIETVIEKETKKEIYEIGFFEWFDEAVKDGQIHYFCRIMPFDCEVNRIVAKCDSGTAKVVFLNNGQEIEKSSFVVSVNPLFSDRAAFVIPCGSSLSAKIICSKNCVNLCISIGYKRGQ